MASKDKDKDKSGEPAEKEDKPKLEPISAAKRKRLQKCFEHGSMLSAKGDFDYADQMFNQCVCGDPGNVIYTKNLLENLIKKYNNNKKGGRMSGMRGAGAKGSMKKAAMKKDWPAVIKSGLDYLRLNPWDVPTLTDMAKASGELEADECQLAYVRLALDGSPNDIALNRMAAETFAHLARYDEAIRCLERISAQKPNDLELAREINSMTVQKTIHKGGYENAESSIDVSVEKKSKEQKTGGGMEMTEEQRLRREIRRHPNEVTSHIALAEYFFKLEDFESAEQAMVEGVQATGAVRAKEELEDIQLHRAQLDLLLAQKRATEKKSDETVTLYKKMKEELNKRELEIFAKRCERYPGDFSLKFELGLRLKRAGKYREAVNEFQQARSEQRKRASANLETGECFQQIKQYSLAIKAYREAVETSGLWDEEVKKLALYRAGWLSKGLKDYDAAEQYLSELAGIDFAYKNVSQLLDEVTQIKSE